MKVLFLITTVGHGKGGHFHSLHTIAEEIGKEHSVEIFNLGVKQSQVLSGNNYEVIFSRYNGYNFLSNYYLLKGIVKAKNYDVIHSFDVESFAFGRILGEYTKLGSFLTKCGGPNPKKYYPIPDNLILFSKENLNYFNAENRYKSSKIKLVPNRVEKITPDSNRIKEFEKRYPCNEYRILRISRISKHYHTSILQSINLLNWLRNNGVPVKLVIIGTVQSTHVFKDIVKYINSKKLEKHVIIETSDLFTKEASGVLNIGDMILGTGRNFMEACSLGKKMLVPYKNSDYPLLVSEENFYSIFSTNFSPRTEWKGFNEKDNLDGIKTSIINNTDSNSEKWFSKYFDVKEGSKKYLELYRSAKRNRIHYFDSIINILYSIKTFVLK